MQSQSLKTHHLHRQVNNAKAATLEGSCGSAINFLRAEKNVAVTEHTALPSTVYKLRHFAAKRRLVEITSEIVLAHQRVNVEQTLSLADEAILREFFILLPESSIRNQCPYL